MKIRFLKRHGLFGKGAETHIADGAGNYLVKVKVAEKVDDTFTLDEPDYVEKVEVKSKKEKPQYSGLPTAKKKKK